MYAILKDGAPVIASPKAVQEHLTNDSGSYPSIVTVKSWTEELRNSLGVYTVQETRDALDLYQQYSPASPLVLSNGVVSQHTSAVDLPLDDAKDKAKGILASKRYEAEVDGTLVGGALVDTGRETQSKLTAVRIIAKEDPTYTVNWKTQDGWLQLDATQIITIADTVRAYVQACFDNEQTLSAAIEAATTVAAVKAIDLDSNWPS